MGFITGLKTFIKALKWGWWALIGIALLVFLYFGFMSTWKKVAFAHKEVKELVSDQKVHDINVATLEKEIEVLNIDFKAMLATNKSDSVNYSTNTIQLQENAKKLLNRAVYAEKLVKEKEKLIENYNNGGCWVITEKWNGKTKSKEWVSPCP